MPYANYLFLIFPLVCGGGIVITHFAEIKIAGSFLYQFGKFFLVGGLIFCLTPPSLIFLVATKLTAGLPQTGFKGRVFCFGNYQQLSAEQALDVFGRFKKRCQEIARFVFISLIGFTLNIGLDYVFVNMVGSFWNMKPILWAQFSAVMAGAITMSWNFLGYKFIVFKVRTAEVAEEKLVLSEAVLFDKK